MFAVTPVAGISRGIEMAGEVNSPRRYRTVPADEQVLLLEALSSLCVPHIDVAKTSATLNSTPRGVAVNTYRNMEMPVIRNKSDLIRAGQAVAEPNAGGSGG